MSGNGWNPNSPYIVPGVVPPQMMPGPYDPTTWAHNPQGTVPNVAGTWPQSNWTGPKSRLSFNTTVATAAYPDVHVPTGAPVYSRATWASPVFDLCPQLLASSSLGPVAVPILRGPSARLYIDIDITAVGADVINLYTCERSHPFDSTRVAAVSAAQAISQALVDYTGSLPVSVRLSFAPPDVGVRFWQVVLVLDEATNLGQTAAINMAVTATS